MRFLRRGSKTRGDFEREGHRVLDDLVATKGAIETDPGAGGSWRWVTLRIRSLAVRWTIHDGRYQLSVRTPKVAVSIDLGGPFALEIPDVVIGGVQAYVPSPAFAVPWAERSRDWLRTPANVRLVEQVDLQDGEMISVQPGWSSAGLRIQGLPVDLERAELFVEMIESVTDPSAPWIRVARLRVADLPEELRDLAPLIRRWAISDDAVRSERMGRATSRTLQRLVDTVWPHLRAIHDSVHADGDPATEARLMLMWLAIAAEEAQLELDRRRPAG